MQKICKKCGKKFEPQQPHFTLCPDCFSSTHKDEDISNLLLKSYYDQKGNFLKEIFIDIPERLAELFSKGELARRKLYSFKKKIWKARKFARLKGIEKARPILLKCIPEVEYQFKTKSIPESFKKFIHHHIPIAVKDTKQLEGFYEHFENIFMYFPIKEERR